MGAGTQPDHVDATCFLQVEPRWRHTGYYGSDASGHPLLDDAKVVAITQERPKKQRSNTVLCKITLRIPAGAFLPLAPEAVVVIPEGLVTAEPIEVEAGDARAPQEDEA